jgi:hypothetical protein
VTTKTIECVECGQPVRNGRLSCPACGALLAAVSRSTRTGAPAGDPPTEDPPAQSLAAAPAYLIEPVERSDIDPATDDWQAPWPPLQASEPTLVARRYGWGASTDAQGPRSAAPPPGAYLPPNLAPQTTTAGAAGLPPATPVTGAGLEAASSAGSRASAGVAPGVDAARLLEIAGWFVVVGSAMAILGFLLPWSVAVIGARSSGGYLDGWGLANPNHILVLVGLLGVLLLGVVQTWVPEWFRTGVLGLGLGGLLIGLTWPYVLGPLGADIGVLVTGLGGLALLVGGGVASWATRHAGADPVV